MNPIIATRRSFFVLCLVAAASSLPAHSALGQFWPGPSADDRPRGVYVDPWQDDNRAEPSRRARRGWERGDDLDDRYERAPHGRPRARARVAALPPDADPAYSTPVDYDVEIDPRQTRRRFVADPTAQTAGTLTINTRARKLYFSLGDGRAVEYAIGVGRQGFAWKGEAQVGRKAFWPGWTPPPEMLERRPDLPEHMDGGLNNPLGARALYLFQGAKDTLFRIHGTNEPESIGRAVSSGCIRLLNADIIDLYQRVTKGARVVVM